MCFFLFVMDTSKMQTGSYTERLKSINCCRTFYNSSWGIHRGPKQNSTRTLQTKDDDVFKANHKIVRPQKPNELIIRTWRNQHLLSHRTNWCSQQWHEGILHNQQIEGGRLKNANPIHTNQSIGINRLVCSAIKLSSSRGIHQCSKQDIRRLSQTKDYYIFRENKIHHEESTKAENKTTQEHYRRKMRMVWGRTTKLSDPKNLMSRLQKLERINIWFSQKTNWCSQQWHEGILRNQQIGGGCLEIANPACTNQSIGIN
jgi:hypothetical protein